MFWGRKLLPTDCKQIRLVPRFDTLAPFNIEKRKMLDPKSDFCMQGQSEIMHDFAIQPNIEK